MTEETADSSDPSSQSSDGSFDASGYKAPDGGWGWVIVFAVFMANFLIDGTVGSFGLFYPELLRTFGSSPALTSMAGSLVVGTYLTTSPVVGCLIRQYGCRPVTFAGGCICASGFILSIASESVLAFMLTYGIVGGVGMGMNSLPGHIMVNMYFNRRRGIAQGIVMSGAGFGVFVMAPLTRVLISEYGWRGAMLITSGIILQFCVCAMLLRPLEHSTTIDTNRNVCNEKNNSDKTAEPATTDDDMYEKRPLVGDGVDVADDAHEAYCSTRCYSVGASARATAGNTSSKVGVNSGIKYTDMTSMPDLSKSHQHQRITSKNHLLHHHLQPNPFLRKDIYYSGSLYRLPQDQFNPKASMRSFTESMAIGEPDSSAGSSDTAPPTSRHRLLKLLRQAGRSVCDRSVFRNKVFPPVLIGAILIQMGQFIPSTFIAEYAYQHGLDGAQISVIISLYGILNIFGRLTAGSLANMRCVSSLWLCNFGTLMCGIACALFPLCRSFEALCLYAICFGFFIGFFPPLQVLIMVDYVGLDKLTSSVGLLQLAKGPAALIGPPLAGVVYEWTKDYGMSIEVAAVLLLLAAGVQSLVPLLYRCSHNDNNEGLTRQSMEIVISESGEAKSNT